MHRPISCENMKIVFTQNYQNKFTLVENTVCQSWRVFETQRSLNFTRSVCQIMRLADALV